MENNQTKEANPIEIRESTRNFLDVPLPADVIDKIETYIADLNNLTDPYGSQIKLELLLKTRYEKKTKI